MAKMEVAKTTNQEVVEPKTNADMSAILERLDKLEKENDELKKGQMNVFSSGKEKYEGPRAYSYKLWGGVPVTGWTSFRKDPTKDLMYKNQFGQWVSNQYLKLELADGKEAEVEVNEFNRDFTRSEKIIAEKRTDTKGNLLGYSFTDSAYGEFIVQSYAIN